EQGQDPLDGRGPNLRDVGRLLQDLTRDVEREVARVNDAPYEAQIDGQQLLGRVHDEDTPHVQLHFVASIGVPEIERRVARNVEELGEFLTSFGLRVRPGQRRLE